MSKRGAVVAAGLRARPVDEKVAICAAVVEHVWPLIADGSVRTVVHTTLPLEKAGEAHRLMESSGHVGKIVLTS
ncbi:MAG: zinc-binding dehydrogenase, partial [Actinomycetes bacterium]